jgi:hypothetical protein
MLFSDHTPISVLPQSRMIARYGRSIGADVTVEVPVGQHVVGMPLRSKTQLGIDVDVGGTTSLVLNGVDIGDHTVIEPLVVGVSRRE